MITVAKVSKKFGPSSAVDGISLTIKPGEIVGLLGPNGAGKTTTLRMLAGVLPPSRGTITIDGKRFDEAEHEIKRRIGYLPEDNPLYDELTVEEHLKFWASLKQIPKDERTKAIQLAVDSVGIGEVYYRLIGELSKGYRQRVGLAQAILSRPDILLLDEPTEGLDPNQRRDIQTLLHQLKKGRTLLVSSHVLGEISRIANRIVIINQGKVVGDDTPTNLTKSSGKQQVVIVEATGKAVLTNLKGLKGVDKVETAEGESMYRVLSTSKQDIRSDIFKLAVTKKWTLLTLKRVERQLEDVFAELTE